MTVLCLTWVQSCLKNPNKGSASSAFVAKFDKNHNLLWAHAAGGNSFDGAKTVNFDAIGNVYIGGYFRSDTLYFGKTRLVNTYPRTNSEDAFIAKYSAAGEFQWARGGGGNGIEIGWNISFEENNVVMKGTSLSKSIRFNDVALVHYDTTRTWESMNFAVKLDPNGNILALYEYDAVYRQIQNGLDQEFYKAIKENKVKISCGGGCYGMAFKFNVSMVGGRLQVITDVRKVCDEKTGTKIQEWLENYLRKQEKLLLQLDKKSATFAVSRILKC